MCIKQSLVGDHLATSLVYLTAMFSLRTRETETISALFVHMCPSKPVCVCMIIK